MKKFFLFSFILLLIFLGGINFVLAEETLDKAISGISKTFDDPEFYKADESISGASSSVGGFLGLFIQRIMELVGVFSLLIFFYSGIIWMTSLGEPTKVKKAQKAMAMAFLGMVIILSSAMLVKYILKLF